MRSILFLLSGSLLAFAQSAPPVGLEPAWDIGVILDELGANASRVLPPIEKLEPLKWAAKGASETYTAQWQSSREQARAIADTAHALAKNPEHLGPALDLFFRIDALERMLGSLEQGARKYQDVASAQAIEAVFAEGSANRERLRRYIVNLATERERQLDVMDKEAQRCRATLFAPVPSKTTGRKK